MSQEIQFILYNLPNEDGKVQVIIKDETLWCTQKAMAELFDVGVPAISKHLKNIFEEGELNETVVISKMEITTQHGARAIFLQPKQRQKQNRSMKYSIALKLLILTLIGISENCWSEILWTQSNI